MRRLNNLFPQIISRDNVEKAHHVAKRGKTKRRDVQRFCENEERNITRVSRLLQTKTFRTATYSIRTIHEPKKRDIFILPYDPDRVVQQAIINIMEPLWVRLFIPDSFSCIKGRGIHAGSRRTSEFVRRNKYFVQFDVSKFYPSINHDVMKEILRKKIKCRDTLWLLDDIVDSTGGETNVPIGNITSQWFGNLYLNELDIYAKHVVRVGDYIRYCDDFLLFGDDKSVLHHQADLLEEFVTKDLRLRLSKRNLARTADGVDFLGYRHFPDFVLLRTRTATRFRRAVKRIREGLDRGTIDNESALSAAASLMGWVMHAKCYRLTKAMGLDTLYGNLHSISRRSKEVHKVRGREEDLE